MHLPCLNEHQTESYLLDCIFYSILGLSNDPRLYIWTWNSFQTVKATGETISSVVKKSVHHLDLHLKALSLPAVTVFVAKLGHLSVCVSELPSIVVALPTPQQM